MTASTRRARKHQGPKSLDMGDLHVVPDALGCSDKGVNSTFQDEPRGCKENLGPGACSSFVSESASPRKQPGPAPPDGASLRALTLRKWQAGIHRSPATSPLSLPLESTR